MKIRLADYVADFLALNGISDCFMVTGGGAMHLNDAIGHKEGITCLFNHHEQACAMAAESYARLENRVAAVCVTTGPGGTNAITGVVGSWLDSIPMLILSGQVRYDTTARYAERYTEGLPLRSVGDQEFDITKLVSCMCKFAAMLEDPRDIRYMLEKSLYLATHGRPGPCWIDIPVNYQGAIIETDELPGYDCAEDADQFPAPLTNDKIDTVIAKIREAKRPVFYAGNSIRLSNSHKQFREVVERLNIPVCTYWDAIDLIETDHPLYVGRAGNMGDRPGNFAVQNADLILVVGNRLPIRVVGYTWETWAREAEVIMVDIDKAELKKHTLHVELPLHADAKDFFNKINSILEGQADKVFNGKEWISTCQSWKKNYPVVMPKHWQENGKHANAYAFVDYLSERLPEGALTVVSNGTCCVVGHQAHIIKKGTRFFNSNAVASMGYGLPAAIGACVANKRQTTICLEGDGSIMMNLQELQTIITNRLPIKIFLINNKGYHSIRQTQNNLFSDHSKVGIGPESGDLTFPNFSEIARVFGYPYYHAHSNKEMKKVVDTVLSVEGFAFCEIFVSTEQIFEPKSATKRLDDGRLVSPPLEDLAPFLPREEFMMNMIIPVLEEK